MLLEIFMYAVAWILVGFVSIIFYVWLSAKSFKSGKYIYDPIEEEDSVEVVIIWSLFGPVIAIAIMVFFIITMIKRRGGDKYPKKIFGLFKEKIEGLYD